MAAPAIEVKGLWKEYMIGGRESAPSSFREMLTGALGAPLRPFRRRGADAPPQKFWALKDVNLEIRPGEVVGIIGRNGAGKSTLLKVLARITDPSRGDVRIRGRVASLLEIGTGFHPELTGRENIYLNGAILGMNRQEIARKFDDIVGFAEVETFLDTPVKRYSSGMYVRLAFAVAAFLESDILFVDEVLAVGDLGFQRKCLGQMSAASRAGRTVLFVSHNMDSIRHLCTKGVVMQNGSVAFQGQVTAAVDNYMGVAGIPGGLPVDFPEPRGEGWRILKIDALQDRIPTPIVRTWDEVTFRIYFSAPEAQKGASVVLQIATLTGTVVALCSTQPDQAVEVAFKKGVQFIDCNVSRLPLAAGIYRIGAGLAFPKVRWLVNDLDAGILVVHEKDVYGSGHPPRTDRYIVPLDCSWTVTHPIGELSS